MVGPLGLVSEVGHTSRILIIDITASDYTTFRCIPVYRGRRWDNYKLRFTRPTVPQSELRSKNPFCNAANRSRVGYNRA